MYKYLKIAVLSLFVFFGVNLSVFAASIYDNLTPGDIIIGNTTFKSGEWISATRASKAGSLFTYNTGSTDVKTYKFVAQGVWFELDEETEAYKPLSSTEIKQIEDTLSIYYKNNEPLKMTYNYRSESYLEYMLEENNDAYYDNNILVDSENNTVTCKYGTVNLITVNTTSFYLECKEGLKIEHEGTYNSVPLEIESITIPSSVNEYPDYITWDSEVIFNNQDKFIVDYSIFTDDLLPGVSNSLGIAFKEKIDANNPYLVFDITVNDANTMGFVSYYHTDDIKAWFLDDTTIRVAIKANCFEFSFNSLVLLDNIYSNFIDLNISITPIDKVEQDLDFDVQVASFEGELAELAVNQNVIKEFKETKRSDLDDNVYSIWNITVIGELNSFEYNDIIGKWVAFEVSVPEGIYLERMRFNKGSGNYYSEIINNKYIVWLDLSVTGEVYGSISNDYINYNNKSFYNLWINYRNFLENDNIAFDFKNNDIYVTNDSSITLEDDSYINYYNTYHDLINNRIYYYNKTDINRLIYKDNESFKTIYVVGDELNTYELVALVYANNDYSLNLMTSGNINSFTEIPNIYGNENIVVHYFFNRDKTPEEIATIEALEEMVNVTLIDDSELYYGE